MDGMLIGLGGVWLASGIWRKGAVLSAKMSETATRPESNVGGFMPRCAHLVYGVEDTAP